MRIDYIGRELERTFRSTSFMGDILERELKYRGSMPEHALAPLFALDFDVIYDFLRPPSGAAVRSSQLALATVSRLSHDKKVAFTLLPGTVMEFYRHLAQIARKLPTVTLADDLLSFVRSEISSQDAPDLDLSTRVRSRLLMLVQQLTLADLSLERLAQFLNAPNLQDLQHSGIDWGNVKPDQMLADHVRALLSQTRLGRHRSNEVDSLNVASVSSALSHGHFFSLISASTRLRDAVRDIKESMPSLQHEISPVISPEETLFRLSIRDMSEKELLSLLGSLRDARSKTNQLLGVFDRYNSGGRGIGELPHELREMIADLESTQQAIDHFYQLERRSHEFWPSVDINIPDDLDLPGVAAHSLALAERLEETLRSACGKLAGLYGGWAELLEQAGLKNRSWGEVVRLIELLRMRVPSDAVTGKLVEMTRRPLQVNVTYLNANESTIGFLNTGDVGRIENIDINIGKLSGTPGNEISRAFKEITERVIAEEALSEELRAELLDQIEHLSAEALAHIDGKARPGVFKALVAGIAAGMGAAGGLAEVWSTWGPQIQDFFRISSGG